MTEEQRRWLLLQLNSRNRGGTQPSSAYTPTMTDYLTRLAAEGGTLTDNEKTWLNALTLNADVAGGEFDRLWIHGVSNQIAARISLVNALTADLLTEANGPTWTAYEGYQGNGTTQYINTNYSPAVDGVKYTLDSASFGAYSLTQNTVSGAIIGAVETGAPNKISRIYPYFISSILSAINQNSDASTAAPAVQTGLFVSARTSAANINTYQNGVSLFTDINASTGLTNLNFFICGQNFNGSVLEASDKKLSISFMGSGAIDQAQFYTDIQALGTNLGWAV